MVGSVVGYLVGSIVGLKVGGLEDSVGVFVGASDG